MSVRAMKWAYGLFELIDIPPAERAVLLALCWDHTDASGCYPSQERIADLSGYRRRHVNTLLKNLENRGLIKRKKTKTKGKYEKTSYTLFGSFRRGDRVRPSAHEKQSNRVRPPAHGDRVRPSAQNRGNIYKGGLSQEPDDIIEFPTRKGAA